MKPVKNNYYSPKVGDSIRRGGEYEWREFFTVAKIHTCSSSSCPRAKEDGCSAKQAFSFEGYPKVTYCVNTNWIKNETHTKPRT